MKYYARLFGLPVEQIRHFDDLTTEQKSEVAHYFSSIGVVKYVYAVKKDGHLVWSRHDKNYLYEAEEARMSER